MEKRNLTLLTDLYQLTMMNGYFRYGKQEEVAVFDVFFRQNGMITYSLACGLEQVVDYVLNLNFGEDEIKYLESLNIFSAEFMLPGCSKIYGGRDRDYGFCIHMNIIRLLRQHSAGVLIQPAL